MKLNNFETVVEVQGDEFEKFESKINTEKLSKLYGMLSSLYRNIYGSIIREYCSNAWDSHKEAGRDSEPIYVKLYQEYNASYLLIKDVGLGMSPSTMQNIYFNYLDSTKEDSNSVIGCFGIGSKSALAYTHTFHIDTVHDGILYHYIFTKQSNGIPAGELLYEEPTDEHNGTTIKIPIKDNDVSTFHYELSKQLVYFPNVYVESDYRTFDNDYTIYDKPLFKYRPGIGYDEIHLALGDVPYTIDWTELNMRSIPIPIAIKFDIGELTPTPSRESIVYSKESIQLIKDKINQILTNIADEYNKTIKDVNSIEDYLKYSKTSGYVSYKITDDVTLEIDDHYIDNIKTVEIKKLKGLIPSNKIVDFFALDYSFYDKAVNNNGYRCDYNEQFNGWYYLENSTREFKRSIQRYNLYILKSTLNHKKNLWLASNSYNTNVFIKPYLKSLVRYKKALGLTNKNKKNWRYIISTFQELSEEYIHSKIKVYDDLVINKAWLDNYEAERKAKLQESLNRRKEEKKIVCYKPGWSYNYDYKWDKDEKRITDIIKAKPNMIYVETKAKGNIMALYTLIRKLGLKGDYWGVVTTAKSYHKYFKEQDHMIEYNELLRTKHPLLVKIATAYHIENNLKDYRFFNKEEFKYINTDVYDKISKLKNYKKNYYRSSWGDIQEMQKIIYNAMVDLDALDSNMLSTLNKVNDYIRDIEKIGDYIGTNTYHSLTSDFNWYKYVTLILKHHNKPINKYWYLKNEYNPVWEMCNPKVEENNNN